MPEISFTNSNCSIADLIGHDPADLAAFRNCNALPGSSWLGPWSAYTLDVNDPLARSVVHRINAMPLQERAALAQHADTMGAELHSLLAFWENNLAPEKLKRLEKANGLAGAGATAASARLSGFQKALADYQKALLDLQTLKGSRNFSGAAMLRIGENKVAQTYQTLLTQYRAEMARYAPEAYRYKNRGNALSNAQRGITLASRRPNARPDPRLFIANTAQAGRMATMIKFLGHAGNAAILLDGYLRIGAIRTAHQDGKDWVKESVVQVTGFGFAGAIGGTMGGAVVKAGTRIGGQIMLRAGMSAVPALLSAGPLGWVILGVVVGVGVYAGYEAGKWGDSKGKAFASDVWNWSKS